MQHDLIGGEEDGDEDPTLAPSIEAQRDAEAKKAQQALRNHLERRSIAYVRTFLAGTPSKEDRDIVLDDLVAFCRGDETTFHENARIHVLLTGRQEVFLRIRDHTRLSLDELYVKYTTPRPPQ